VIGKDSEYLGHADIAALTIKLQSTASVMVLSYDNDFTDDSAPISLGSYLSNVSGGAWEFLPDSPDLEAFSSTWLIACCKANFQKGPYQSLNHYLPLFVEAQLGKDQWSRSCEILKETLDLDLAKLSQKVENLADDPDSDELLHDFRQQQAKCAFFDKLMQMGFLPVDGPGDGNCALWTLHVLQSGFQLAVDDSTKKRVSDLRKEAWFGQ